MDKFSDYIVVGGGASGCALTNKLLSANKSVTLIEAGYSHHNFLLDVPAGFFKLINDSSTPSSFNLWSTASFSLSISSTSHLGFLAFLDQCWSY